MENHHVQWENPLFLCSCSTAIYVSLPEGIPLFHIPEYFIIFHFVGFHVNYPTILLQKSWFFYQHISHEIPLNAIIYHH